MTLHADKYKEQVSEAIDRIIAINGNVPLHRRESKRLYSFSGEPFVIQLAIWDELWHHSQNFWVKVHAFFFLERNMKSKERLLEMWPVIVRWQDSVDDWGLCDSLAKIYTRILEIDAAGVYSQLEKWNTAADLWKRRQSVVSLLYFSRTKKIYPTFGQIETLISTLLGDKEYYVQKGVGWALREMHTVYPDESYEWLKIHIKQISAIAFTIAIEKMGVGMKDELKAMRKGR